jgi:hypothetical protein
VAKSFGCRFCTGGCSQVSGPAEKRPVVSWASSSLAADAIHSPPGFGSGTGGQFERVGHAAGIHGSTRITIRDGPAAGRGAAGAAIRSTTRRRWNESRRRSAIDTAARAFHCALGFCCGSSSARSRGAQIASRTARPTGTRVVHHRADRGRIHSNHRSMSPRHG